MPFLEAKNNTGERELHEINKDYFRIGRGDHADLQVEDDKASRPHCEIQLQTPKPILKDLNSRNGTYLNDEKIERTELSGGDVVRIGDMEFTYHRTHPDGLSGKIDTPRSETTGGSVSLDLSERMRSALFFPSTPIILIAGVLLFLGATVFVVPYLSETSRDTGTKSVESNLVKTNHSFEDTDPDRKYFATGWQIRTNLKNLKLTSNPGEAADGNYALHVRPGPAATPEADSHFAVRYRTEFDIQGGASLLLKGMVQAKGDHGFAGFRIGWLNEGEHLFYSYSNLVRNQNDWTETSTRFTPPETADKFVLEAVGLGRVQHAGFDRVFMGWDPKTEPPHSHRSISANDLTAQLGKTGELTLRARNQNLFLYGTITSRNKSIAYFDQHQLRTDQNKNRSVPDGHRISGTLFDYARQRSFTFRHTVKRSGNTLEVHYDLENPPERNTFLQFQAIVPKSISRKNLYRVPAKSENREEIETGTGWTNETSRLILNASRHRVEIRFQQAAFVRLEKRPTGHRTLIIGFPFSVEKSGAPSRISFRIQNAE